jgi:hypothetical protein
MTKSAGASGAAGSGGREARRAATKPGCKAAEMSRRAAAARGRRAAIFRRAAAGTVVGPDGGGLEETVADRAWAGWVLEIGQRDCWSGLVSKWIGSSNGARGFFFILSSE